MNLLLITGGNHPYEESTPVLQEFLEEAGHSITLSESANELSGDLSAFDAIVLNTLRQEATDNDLNDAQRSGFESYVSGGGSLLSIHISAASCHGVVEGDIKPLGWTHQFGQGKVANIALGHAGSSQQHPQFQKLILNALNYLS